MNRAEKDSERNGKAVTAVVVVLHSFFLLIAPAQNLSKPKQNQHSISNSQSIYTLNKGAIVFPEH
jgi:hypothetical protein